MTWPADIRQLNSTLDPRFLITASTNWHQNHQLEHHQKVVNLSGGRPATRVAVTKACVVHLLFFGLLIIYSYPYLHLLPSRDTPIILINHISSSSKDPSSHHHSAAVATPLDTCIPIISATKPSTSDRVLPTITTSTYSPFAPLLLVHDAASLICHHVAQQLRPYSSMRP